ncbi:hypothetical protein CQW23_09654 [Capsicum baccatum]|uniref:Uncharacterized protein n=1 Tax=Capsicum baccatum TaxID=33114 RepID=A0A2G2WXE6_CAPBA|nr:hypothetical protein CQW23_09654 [Capsicum baccatum]
MNRDLGPSFSLGFSQLESIKESQEVVNFVPGSFDYEFIGFDENRSKHRNNLQTMKKLRQKHANKNKKKESSFKKRGSNSPASKAPAKRRRIVETISRDKLPKDRGAFVVVYIEYLSKELGIPSSGIDAQYHRLKYASLLCKYGFEKLENDYFSENDDPPRPSS